MKKSYTDANLSTPTRMTDDDNEMPKGVEAQFKSGASMADGVSGLKKIDTEFENTSEAKIDTPRSGELAPEQANEWEHSHRRM